MIKSFSLVVTAAVGVTSMPAFAQDEPPIGSRLGKRHDIIIPQTAKESTQAAHRLAGCIYMKQPANARAALDTLDPKDAEKRLSNLDSRGTCINLSMVADDAHSQQARIPTEIYRGMMAEAAMRHDQNLASLLAPLPRKASYGASWFAVTGRPLAVDEMSACMAETDPAGIRNLLVTTAETPEEKKAFSALTPGFGPCLTTGATLNANRQSMRAALAEALYHRAVAPPVPVASQN